MSAVKVAERLDRIRERIDAACSRAGRAVGEVQLVAVCKRIPLHLVVDACRAGQWDLGENRIQEAVVRQEEFAALLDAARLPRDRVRWHFIGHLQRNKAGKATGRFALLHAVDSARLAERLETCAAGSTDRQSVLLEVNMSGEEQKCGVSPQQTRELALRIAGCSHLRLEGLMTMARFGAEEIELRRTFAGLRELAERVGQAVGFRLPHLSMGMSEDFETAIAEGATIVRIGTAIFGRRSVAG